MFTFHKFNKRKIDLFGKENISGRFQTFALVRNMIKGFVNLNNFCSQQPFSFWSVTLLPG